MLTDCAKVLVWGCGDETEVFGIFDSGDATGVRPTERGDCGGGEFDKDGYKSSAPIDSPGKTSSNASSTAAELDMVGEKNSDESNEFCCVSSMSLPIMCA